MFPEFNFAKELNKGDFVINLVKDRTEAGRDRHGNYFAKKKNGENADLKDTGKMLDDLQMRVVGDSIEVSFSNISQEEKAKYHIRGTDKMPQRDFMGLTDADLDKIVDKLLDGAFK
jgi:phage gpG-like protein